MHDIWIGFVAGIFFKTVFVDEKTLLYRRHGGNASFTSEQSMYRMKDKIIFRLNLIRYIPLIFARRYGPDRNILSTFVP
jgi:hypothetical protein